MSKSIQEILGGRNMTGVFKEIQSGLPNYLPPAFLNVTNRVIGNTATYFKVRGERNNAETNAYGAPAKIVNGQQMTEVGITLAHVFEQFNHNPVALQNLMGFNGEPAKMLAVEEVDRQSREFKVRCENARLSAVYSVLANGKIYLDGKGRILYSSSGATVTVDYGVPAARLNQAAGIIGASWGTASTDIIGDIVALKKQQVQDGKPPLRHAYYGSNLAGYIAANTEAKELIQRTPALATQRYIGAEIPQGFAGLEWHPVYGAYGLNSSGAVTEWFGADTLVLTPEPMQDWWGFYEGSFPVPRDIGIVGNDPVAAANNLDVVHGQFAYATVGHNPPTINQYAGDTFLPVLKDASALFILDVTP